MEGGSRSPRASASPPSPSTCRRLEIRAIPPAPRAPPRGPGVSSGQSGCRGAAGAGAGLAGCGGGGVGPGSGDSVTTTVTSASPEAQTQRVIVETAAHGFDAAAIYREAAPGVVTIRSIFDEGGGAEGSGFVLDTQGRHRHQRPRRHRRIGARRRTQGGQGSLRRVPRPQRRLGEDRRLRPLRRRRPARSRTRRLRPAPAEARRRRRPRRRPAGGGDRQPVRRAALALGRRRSRRPTARSNR